jgi:GNAT superfamily N-acetyltransferase
MLLEAGQLLASRHKANRNRLPLLPPRFANASVTFKAVQTLWNEKFKGGYAAFRDGKMSAYLLGHFTVQPWGRCGYVPLPGYALAKGETPSLIQDLYAQLGEDWVNSGVFSHGLYISAADSDVIEALFDIGFGKERMDALLDIRTLTIPEQPTTANIVIRRAGSGDGDHLGGLSDIISRTLANGPYWHPTVPEVYQELQEGWSELAENKDWTVWLAFEGNEAVGAAGFTAQVEADTDMLASPRNVYLSVAATKPEAHGRGIGTVLTWHGLEQARQNGYEICYTNWISPNLLASRHWPRYGFKEVACRLSKRIDPQIAWARGTTYIR